MAINSTFEISYVTLAFAALGAIVIGALLCFLLLEALPAIL